MPDSLLIPACPEVLVELASVMQEQDPDIQLVSDLVNNDVGLYTTLLATVNSPALGLKHCVESIPQAIMLLGQKRTFTLLHSVILRNSLDQHGRMDRFWDTATEVAGLCSRLAAQLTSVNQDKAYSIGMLHDIGIPVMMANFPDYKDFLRDVNSLSLREISAQEVEHYQIDHFTLGYRLAKEWHLPTTVSKTILLQPLFEPTESFPNTVLFQIMRINDMLILPLPFEITSESGRRISARVKSEFLAANQEIKHSWVASVANGYFGYSATPEEYEYQSYEGASTLYGRYSTPYISAQLGVLAKDMQLEKVEELRDEWKYLLKTNHFLPVLEDSTGIRKVLTEATSVLAEEAHEENYYAVEWQDVGPSQIKFHQSLVHVEAKTDQGWQVLAQDQHRITDEGYDVEVRLLDTEDQGMGTYQARWYNPEVSREACKAGCRFVIAKRGQHEQEKVLYSAEFNL